VDSDTPTVAMEIERFDRSEMFDDSCEHGFVGALLVECTAFRSGRRSTRLGSMQTLKCGG
jgi:hypothetical protein